VAVNAERFYLEIGQSYGYENGKQNKTMSNQMLVKQKKGWSNYQKKKKKEKKRKEKGQPS
jgi:hypothetical protein